MWKSSKNVLYLLLVIISLGTRIEPNEAAANGKKKVCVIGAGPAGLTSARHLVEYPDDFDIVVFERNAEIGGTWLYSNLTDVDKHNLTVSHSMYKNLRIHLPKDIMTFPDYRNFFDSEGRSCVTHETVLSYLKNYTEHFNLRQYIQFNTFVEKVTPITIGSDWHDTQYLIRSKNLDTNQDSETTCDAVMVCNGHYLETNIPKILGIETFPGKVIHSKAYRKPEDYKNQVVVLLGSGISGIDISVDISKLAKTVYLSHNTDKIKGSPPANVIQVPGVVGANGSELILKDGSSIKADAFIYCTGYNYTYPFLDETSHIIVDDNHVVPLYKHLINVEHPKMSFLGITTRTNQFPTMHIQAKYVVALLRGKVQLPSKSVMMLDTKVPEGQQKRYAHNIRFTQYSYLDELAQAAGFEPLPFIYREVWSKWIPVHQADPWTIKQYNAYISENFTVTVSKPSKDLRNDTKH